MSAKCIHVNIIIVFSPSPIHKCIAQLHLPFYVFVVYRKNGVSERPTRMQKAASERSLRSSLLPYEGVTRKRGPGPNGPKTGPLLVRCWAPSLG